MAQTDRSLDEGKPRARRSRGSQRTYLPRSDEGAPDLAALVDPYRSVVFPNRIREQRIRRGHSRLFAFASLIPRIPYIRLSKIERGEVFARADELVLLADQLGMPPAELLLDVDTPDFDIAVWFVPFADGTASDSREEAEFAVMLAAAVRAKRDAERITANTMDADFGIPPVILSRIENAQKGLARWNDQTVANLCKLFGAANEDAMREHVAEMYKSGALDPFFHGIASADQRLARSRQRIAALRMGLGQAEEGVRLTSPAMSTALTSTKSSAVFGSPLPDGLIAMTPTDSRIEVTSIVGARAFGLRVCRATLGGGLPGQAIVIVDPDRFPQAGGLALIREGEGYRILAIVLDREGRMMGYSISPEREVPLDTLLPQDVAAIVAAQFV